MPTAQGGDGWLYWYTNWEMGNNRLPSPSFVSADNFSRSNWDPAVPTEYGAFEDSNLIYPGRRGPVMLGQCPIFTPAVRKSLKIELRY